MNRRTLIGVGAASLLLHALSRPLIAAQQAAKFVQLSADIPWRLFLPGRVEAKALVLSGLELAQDEKIVVVRLSNGSTVSVDAQTSTRMLMGDGKTRSVSRQALLPKSLAAWVIDAVWRSIGNERDLATAVRLQLQFDELQRARNLDTVTPMSLYRLVETVARYRRVSAVSWDAGTKLFRIGGVLK